LEAACPLLNPTPSRNTGVTNAAKKDPADWLPVVKIFLDVGVDRPPRPLVLDIDDNPDPAEICFRCANGCVGITATGQFIPMVGYAARKLDHEDSGRLSA
jgi:hypothetical protein